MLDYHTTPKFNAMIPSFLMHLAAALQSLLKSQEGTRSWHHRLES